MSKAIYLFHGEEDFLIEEKINALKSQIDNPALNVETFDGEDLSLEALSSALRTPPMFGGEKMVMVRNFALSSENQAEIISLIENIPEGVKVVFHAQAIDKRSRFYKLMDEQGEAIEFRSFAPWEQEAVVNWIKAQVRSGGKKIDDAGARLLQETCGNNLRMLSGEIEKLITFVGERSEIAEGDVSALASPGEVSAFALLDALRKKDVKAALSLLQVLLRNRTDVFQLLALLTTQYRLMLQIKSFPGKGEITRQVAGSPYFVKKCRVDIHRFTIEELKAALEKLLEANLRMKTGESQLAVFELLLASLCGA